MVERLTTEQGDIEVLLSKIEQRGEREGGLIEAMVPVELIDNTEVAVDENHVRELLESMNIESEKGIVSGQLTPVLLGHVPGREKLSIIDGFHRSAALEIAGKEYIFATIRLNTSEEEIEDLRILTANSHSSVSFARINSWVTEAWEKTSWSSLITSAQAFGLANNKKLTGAKLGLDSDQVTEIRAWALDKCNRWRMSASTITQTMTTALVADPELVNAARGRESGHELKTLTPQHLKEVTKVYPNEFGIQKAVAEVAITHNLTVLQLKQVLELLSAVEATEDVETILINKDWAAMFEGQSRSRGRKTKGEKAATGYTTPEKPEKASGRSAEKSGQNNVSESRSVILKYAASRIVIARLQLENTVLKGEYLVPPAGQLDTQVYGFDLSKYPVLVDAAKPVGDTTIQESFIERFEALTPKLEETFASRTGSSESTSASAVKEIGRRIGLDLQRGALRFVEITRPYILDELIRACLADEVRTYQNGRNAIITNIDHTVPTFEADTAVDLLPMLAERTQTPFMLSGAFAIGSHSIAQVIHVDHQTTDILLQSTKERLEAAHRIKHSQLKGEQNEKVLAGKKTVVSLYERGEEVS